MQTRPDDEAEPIDNGISRVLDFVFNRERVPFKVVWYGICAISGPRTETRVEP